MGCNAEAKTDSKVQNVRNNKGTTSFTFKEKCSPYRRQKPKGMTSLESMNYHYQTRCVAGGGYGGGGNVGTIMLYFVCIHCELSL
jgi:hypothetical protein